MKPITKGIPLRWQGLNKTDNTPQPNEAVIANAKFPDKAEFKKEKILSIILIGNI